MENTLTPEQIKNWRSIIAIQIYETAKSRNLTDDQSLNAAFYAHIMPESEVIDYYRRMKLLIENSPEVKQEKVHEPKVYHKKRCDHSNSIKGSNGRYCLDCEMYV